MFDAAYWRAKEGELARTIVESPYISSARVHIAQTGSTPFQRQIAPTASVSIATSGGGLPAGVARSLKYLIASAVAGLTVDNVAVIDGSGGLIDAMDEAASTAPDAREEEMRLSVQRLLEARVGPGNAIVEISIDSITETESIREHVFDPKGRVAISVDTQEKTSDSRGNGGQVTIASNLPDGDTAGGDESQSQNSETRERINYEVSETLREVTRGPGAIRRLTVAVLVNGNETINETGSVELVPRNDAELTALRELVASAVGYSEARGDVITLKSMNFLASEPPISLPRVSFMDTLMEDSMALIQLTVLALVSLGLGLFVLRPLLLTQSKPSLAGQNPAPPATSDDGARSMPLTGEIQTPDDATALPAPTSEPLPASSGDAVARLRDLIGERHEETVEILRSWLEDDAEETPT
jgi:flagellar M-ring protein FliF